MKDSKKTTGSGRQKDSKGSNGVSKKGAKPESVKSLNDLLEDGLKDIYNAEKQLLKALPEMEKAACSQELQDAFAEHLLQTQDQVERLEDVFERLETNNKAEKCAAMEGLIEEGKKIISEYEEGAVRDAALIIASQKIEHYEIASYGSMCELAEVLGYYKIADILKRTLKEEGETDHLLTDIAKVVNEEAFDLQEKELELQEN